MSGQFWCTSIRKAAEDGPAEGPRSDAERLADASAPAIARAVAAALEAQAERAAEADIEPDVAAQDVPRLQANLASFDAARIAQVDAALENAIIVAGQFEARKPQLVRGQYSFNRLAPELLEWIDAYSLDMIREVNDRTREAIRAALRRGTAEGRGPADVARQVRQAVGLTEQQSRAVETYRSELERIHERRSAAGWGLGNTPNRRNGNQTWEADSKGRSTDGIHQRRLRDFRYDGQVARAIETRTPLTAEQIDRMVTAYKRKALKARSETIARTEAIRTANAGQYEAWRQAIASGAVDAALVRKMWLLAPDERVCPRCRPIPGLNPKRGVRLDQPFKTSNGRIMLPPEHPNCRCAISILLWEPSQLNGE